MLLSQPLYVTATLLSGLWCALADGVAEEVHRDRHLVQSGIDCIPLLRLTQYEQSSFHPGPHSEWNCQLLSSTPAAMGKRGKTIKLNDIYNLPEGTVQKFKSGATVLTISGATVTSAGIQISQGAQASILPTGIEARRLQTDTVDKKVLVVRVKTWAATTTPSVRELSDSVFGSSGDPVNLSTQYDKCSYGKMTFSPTRLNDGDPTLRASGVYEVEIATSSRDHEVLREMIADKLNADFPNTPLPDVSWGVLDERVPFDHVMYCMPPGTSMGIAHAFVDSWLSVYKDEWCTIARMLVKFDQGQLESLFIPSLVAVFVFMLPGAWVVLQTGYLFFTKGGGTPSPAPNTLKTQQCVIEGPYQYTRNPMVSAKAWFLLGMSLLFHSTRLALFAVVFVLIGTAFFVLYEEPDLRNRFGQEYIQYCRNVPRWIPRRTPYVAIKKKSG